MCLWTLGWFTFNFLHTTECGYLIAIPKHMSTLPLHFISLYQVKMKREVCDIHVLIFVSIIWFFSSMNRPVHDGIQTDGHGGMAENGQGKQESRWFLHVYVCFLNHKCSVQWIVWLNRPSLSIFWEQISQSELREIFVVDRQANSWQLHFDVLLQIKVKQTLWMHLQCWEINFVFFCLFFFSLLNDEFLSF